MADSRGHRVVRFAGAQGWRLATLVELQTIVLDFECKGGRIQPDMNLPVEPPPEITKARNAENTKEEA